MRGGGRERKEGKDNRVEEKRNGQRKEGRQERRNCVTNYEQISSSVFQGSLVTTEIKPSEQRGPRPWYLRVRPAVARAEALCWTAGEARRAVDSAGSSMYRSAWIERSLHISMVSRGEQTVWHSGRQTSISLTQLAPQGWLSPWKQSLVTGLD